MAQINVLIICRKMIPPLATLSLYRELLATPLFSPWLRPDMHCRITERRARLPVINHDIYRVVLIARIFISLCFILVC